MKERTIRKILAVTIGICIAVFLAWNILRSESPSLVFKNRYDQSVK